MFTIDIQDFNGSWRTEVESTAWEAYVHIAGITDAAQVNVNDVNVSSLEALDAWYETQQAPVTPPPAPFEDAQQTDEPADVDMGGDFDGFIAEVNAGQVKPAAQVWYTDPVTSADGEQIKARVMQRGEYGFLIELLLNDSVDDGASEIGSTYRYAMLRANEIVNARRIKIDSPFNRGSHIRFSPGGTISLKTGKAFDYPPLIDKAARIAQLTAHIERIDRERDSLAFELAQLVGGE